VRPLFALRARCNRRNVRARNVHVRSRQRASVPREE
jgi:hypothetical protein